MITSGETGISTSSADPVTLLENPNSEAINELSIINEGAEPGFISVNDGPWFRLPAGPSSRTFDFRKEPRAFRNVRLKRSGASDVTDVYADGF